MFEFISLIATVALAEIGDKTQISILLLSTQIQRPARLLLGVFTAFLVVDGIAVIFGSMIKYILPAYILRVIGSLTFIVLGIFLLVGWRSEKQANIKKVFRNPFTAGFSATFLAEWCDKTQISTSVLATRFNWLEVFIATMAALVIISMLTILLGRVVLKKIGEEKMLKISGVGFLLIGILFLLF
ncbi:MAG: UPF0016 domain-containing protein [Thaumarchaeota archaeon]|nr:MAG: UPF0016 domain-containing protein [Nitrososphaerota archaeon]